MRKIAQLTAIATVAVALTVPASAHAVQLVGPGGSLPIGAQVTFTSPQIDIIDGLNLLNCTNVSFKQTLAVNSNVVELDPMGDATIAGGCGGQASVQRFAPGKTYIAATSSFSFQSCLIWRGAMAATGTIYYTPQVGSGTLPILKTATYGSVPFCNGWSFPKLQGQFTMTDQNGAAVTLQN